MAQFEVGKFYDIKLDTGGRDDTFYSCEVLAIDADFIRIKFPDGNERDLDIIGRPFVSAKEGRPPVETFAKISPFDGDDV